MAILAGALLGACGDDGGSGGDDGEAAEAAEGCGLLADEEVADAVGVAIDGETSVPAGCQYQIDPELGSFFQWQTVPAASYEENRRIAEETAGSFSVEEVPELGDEAFRRNGLGGDGSVVSTDLWILVGDEAVFVSSGLIDVADAGPAQEDLAELIVDRIG